MRDDKGPQLLRQQLCAPGGFRTRLPARPVRICGHTPAGPWRGLLCEPGAGLCGHGRLEPCAGASQHTACWLATSVWRPSAPCRVTKPDLGPPPGCREDCHALCARELLIRISLALPEQSVEKGLPESQAGAVLLSKAFQVPFGAWTGWLCRGRAVRPVGDAQLPAVALSGQQRLRQASLAQQTLLHMLSSSEQRAWV